MGLAMDPGWKVFSGLGVQAASRWQRLYEGGRHAFGRVGLNFFELPGLNFFFLYDALLSCVFEGKKNILP
jgi:hypothetical protein